MTCSTLMAALRRHSMRFLVQPSLEERVGPLLVRREVFKRGLAWSRLSSHKKSPPPLHSLPYLAWEQWDWSWWYDGDERKRCHSCQSYDYDTNCGVFPCIVQLLHVVKRRLKEGVEPLRFMILLVNLAVKVCDNCCLLVTHFT